MAELTIEMLAPILAREMGVEITELTRLPFGASAQTYSVITSKKSGETEQLCLRRKTPGAADQEEKDATAIPISTEAEVIALAGTVQLPVPEVYYVFTEGDGLGEGFLMQWLEGETLGSRIVRLDQQKMDIPQHSLAYQCGQLLGRLHSGAKLSQLSSSALSSMPRTSASTQAKKYWRQYQHMEAKCGPRPVLDYCFRWLVENAPEDEDEDVLVHGDFRNGNLMIDEEKGVVAVLDW